MTEGKRRAARTRLVKSTIQLPEALWRRARLRALAERTPFHALVARALMIYLKINSTKPTGRR